MKRKWRLRGSKKRARKVADIFPVFWLRLEAERKWVIYIVLPLILWAAIRVVLNYVGLPLANIGREAALNAFLALLSLIVPPVITATCLLRHLKLLIKGIGGQKEISARKMMLEFTLSELIAMHDLLSQIRSEKGAKVDRLRLLLWIRLCFQTFSGNYVGIDSSLPSEFRKRYEGYLDAHELYIRTNPKSRSLRIIIRHPQEIDADRYSDPTAFENFIEWHQKNGVEVQWASITDARELSQKYGLHATDVAIWEGEAAILFNPVSSEAEHPQVILRMTLSGEKLFENVARYVSDIKERSAYLPELHMIPEKFIQHWGDFVSPTERKKTSVPFLENVIKKTAERCSISPGQLRILDGGVGLGIEAAELLKKGYWIEINEIDSVFLKLGQSYIMNVVGREIPRGRVHQVNWRAFRSHFGESAFHLIYILGNSLCLLRDSEDVLNVLSQFEAVIVPGGALVVDERNFGYIWSE